MKKIMLLILLLSTALVSGFAENAIELKKAEFMWSVDGDELSISMKAETKGWLAVGLGTRRMDGSTMFMGYNKDSEAYFEEHLGKGHSHKKTAVQRPVEFEVTEENGETELKFTVLKSDFVKSGQTDLPVIVAYGTRDNFSSIHRYRDSTTIEF